MVVQDAFKLVKEVGREGRLACYEYFVGVTVDGRVVIRERANDWRHMQSVDYSEKEEL